MKRALCAMCIVLMACLPIAAKEDVKLTLVTPSWGLEFVNELVQRYEKDKNVKVEVQVGSLNHITTRLIGGVETDIVLLDAYWAKSVFAQGLMMSLDPYIKRDGFDLNSLLPPLVEEYRGIDGKIYGLYTGIGGGWAAMYNETILGQSGMERPSPNWTWNEFRAMAKKLTVRDGDGKVTRWGTIGIARPTEAYWASFLLSNGGAILDESLTRCVLDNARSRETFEFISALVLEDKSHPLPQDWGQIGGHKTGFVNNKVAITFDWDVSGVPHQKAIGDTFSWRLNTAPAGRAGNIAWFKGTGFSIPNTSKQPEQAWEFLKYLYSDEIQHWIYQLGYRPGVRAILTNARYLIDTIPPYDWGVVYQQQITSIPMIPKWTDMSRIWNEEINDAFTGKRPVATVLTTITSRINGVLADK